jgi:hypothetical protein
VDRDGADAPEPEERCRFRRDDSGGGTRIDQCRYWYWCSDSFSTERGNQLAGWPDEDLKNRTSCLQVRKGYFKRRQLDSEIEGREAQRDVRFGDLLDKKSYVPEHFIPMANCCRFGFENSDQDVTFDEGEFSRRLPEQLEPMLVEVSKFWLEIDRLSR